MADEIKTRTQLEEWLRGSPKQVVEAVALRAMARVVPIVFNEADWEKREVDPIVVLAILRTLLVSSCPKTVDNKEALLRARTATANASREVSPSREGVKNASYIGSLASSAVSKVPPNSVLSAIDAIAAYAAQRAPYSALSAGKEPARVAAYSDILQSIIDDCRLIQNGEPLGNLRRQRLWPSAPLWWESSWKYARKWLSRRDEDFDVWREWFFGVYRGLPYAFAEFQRSSDTVFYRWIARQDDDWWSREPSKVNKDIADFVEDLRDLEIPTDEELQQNPRAFTFSLDEEGRSTLDEDLLPNGLQGDEDERDNHGEILRLIEKALVATAGDTNAKAIADPTKLLKEAVGQSVEDLRPRLFVLRAREVMRWVDESNSEDMRIPGLSKAQTDAFVPLVAALEMIAQFSPKLAELWHGKLGQTGTPLTREMLDLIAEALRTSGQTNALAQAIIEASNRQVAPDAPEDDPARIAASETSRNAVRKMGSALKKAGDGADSAEKILSLGERVATMWGSLRGKLPSSEVIARILGVFGGGS